MEEYYSRVDEMFENMKNTPPAKGFSRVYIPGELEQIKYDEAVVQGIEISDVVIEDLIELGKEYGVRWPFA
jgi:LDH2 family malate/lactate/ureidoglycolate dehydrogenase